MPLSSFSSSASNANASFLIASMTRFSAALNRCQRLRTVYGPVRSGVLGDVEVEDPSVVVKNDETKRTQNVADGTVEKSIETRSSR